MEFDLSERSLEWRDRLQAFFDKEVLARHRDWAREVAIRGEASFMPDLQRKARTAGLWNLALPELAADEPGTRLSNLDYAPCAEIMGRLFWAPEVFNCQAPDVPNMIALQDCANDEQKRRWLHPLLEGQTRSAFGMTEPDVASSDATNIATTITRQGDDYIVRGRKWFITGAAHPQCSFLIVMGVSHPDASRTSRHSCVVVPMDAKGVRLVRPLRWMGCTDHVAPIGEIDFDDVRVPVENLLGNEGEGFRVAQVRLGPARIHHCMRSIGLCEVLIELMLARAAERSAFGRAIIEYDTVQRWIACRTRTGAALELSLRLAARPRRSPGRLARRFADQGFRAGDAATHCRPRHAGVRRHGRLGRHPDPSSAGVGTLAADRRRAGRGAPAANLQDGNAAAMDHRQLALSVAASGLIG
jgi:acyl-CoA dehydrogenase